MRAFREPAQARSDLCGEPQLPDILQNSPKSWFRDATHSSIRIQEGEPSFSIIISTPSFLYFCLGTPLAR
jgi:hypothetical protein